MKKMTLLMALLFFCSWQIIYAQVNITGKVTDSKDGMPLPGVSIQVKGTSVGTITDSEGNYSIAASSGQVFLIKFIGYAMQELIVGNQTVVDIALEVSDEELTEVVVTALGVKREKKALGYAMSTVKAEELTKNGNPVSPLMALYGKSAGVRIAATSNGPTGGMIINIRNSVSLNEGSNTRPLFVVDGIPIYDQNTGTTQNDRDGRDRGTGINDINAEDIASIDILKGAKAAVLYGYAGANGVVLITTKKGSQKRGIGVDVNTSYTWDNPAFMPEFQNEFGSGGNVAYMNISPDLADEDGFKYEMINGQRTPVFFNNTGSFGPKMDGRNIYWYDTIMRPYNPQPNNYKELFNTGHSLSTNVAISFGGPNGGGRFSYTNKDYKSVMLGASQKNHVISFSGNFNVGKFIKLNFNSNYYYTLNHNSPYRIQDFATYGVPRDLKTDLLKDNILDESGVYSYWAMNKDIRNRATDVISGAFGTGYLWNQTQNSYDETRHHFLQSISMNVTITPWLNLSLLGGFDMTHKTYVVKQKFTQPIYQDSKQGYYSQQDNYPTQYYGQALLNLDKKIGDDFRLSGTIGTTYQYNTEKTLYGLTKNFNIENFFKFNNSNDVSTYTGWGDEGDDLTYSVLASANISYKDYLYLELQGRNDWTSILPPSSNSYFYPGVSLTWIASESLNLPDFISFAKLRGAWADVGRPGTRYFGNISYEDGVYGTIPWATASGSMPPVEIIDGKLVLNLKPERKREFEVGFDVRFFNSRLGVDVAIIKSNNYDQIMALTVPRSSGVNEVKVNAGDIQSSGYEIQLNATPVLTKDFSWTTTLNFSHYKNEIKKLAKGIEIQPLWGVTGAYAQAKVGGEYGEIYINPWLRNDNGELVVNSEGLYDFDKENRKKVGVTIPKILGSFNTRFTYKSLSLDLDFDYQFGGTLISQSNMFGLGNGTFKESLKYRDEERGGLPYYVDVNDQLIQLSSHNVAVPSDSKYSFIFHDGVVLPGVKDDGTPNDIIMSAQKYYERTYWQGYMDITEDVVYKSDYISLRRITLSYELPSELTRRIFIERARVGVFAYNVAYLYKVLPNVTPESTSNTNEFVEYSNMPGVRVMGFELKLSF